jgi:ADP-heptose:LPS heptosyltransferase
VSDFKRTTAHYLKVNPLLNIKFHTDKKVVCGVAWTSNNAFIGKHKSMSLIDLSSILQLRDVEFISLQYGDTKKEIDIVREKLNTEIRNIEGIDLYDDIDSLLGLIDACDIVITTSNSTAHLSGALGKETILLLPFSVGKFWYWHELDGASLWYPSVRVFKQLKQGDWSDPVIQARRYLEKRFAI